MERSLNSSRNFKLPPIQEAAPAANILHSQSRHNTGGLRSVPVSTHRSVTKPRPVAVHVPSDPFPGRHRSSSYKSGYYSSGKTVSSRGFNGVSENARNSKLTLEFSVLGHQFPQSYSVLPPIQKIRQATSASVGNSTTHADYGSAASKSAGFNGEISERSTVRDTRKHEHDQSENFNFNDAVSGEKKAHITGKSGSATEKQETKMEERKPSATFLLFLKGTRKGRRLGICVENEPSLINVTERLKEIFLRRNMEEMYLI